MGSLGCAIDNGGRGYEIVERGVQVPSDIELMLSGPNEQACTSRRGCTTLHLNAFVSRIRLPLHPFFRWVLQAYSLALTQVAPNGWSQMVKGLYLYFQHSFGMEMPLHAFQTIYQMRKLSKKKGREENLGWYYFCPWGSHRPLVTDCPSSIKQWKESWFWVVDAISRCELSSDNAEVLRSTYQASHSTRRYEFILNSEVPQADTFSRLTKQSSRVLAPGSSEDCRQKKVIENLSWERNREEVEAPDVVEIVDTGAPMGDAPLTRKRKAETSGVGTSPQPKEKTVEIVDNYVVHSALSLQLTLSVNPLGEVVLESPPNVTQNPGGPDRGPYNSKKKLRELIGAPRLRMPDDALRNLPFYPSLGTQAVKKYFTPKWKEFASHGDLEDVLEASLAAAIKASEMQLKVLGEFRTRMQEHKKLIVEMLKFDKEHRVTTEALEAAKKEKKWLLDESKCHEQEVQSLREKERKEAEAEAEVTRLLGEKKEMEAKLKNVEADFVANFHNTEAYTNFSNYFARVGY
ncbi:Plus3 domain-containing protein [Abeliophyllum distichum]|uniref:Plus3 domain-containing protein n=1 Tax=Abeliophyllum distichum TaxID=126358 RepID=A0ABD1V637_9LAMI